MVRAAAKNRNMEPVEYMSQIFAPRVGGKLTADEMAASIRVLRASPSAHPEQVVRQMADAFEHYLDPSALRQLEEHYAAHGGSFSESIANRIAPEQGKAIQAADEPGDAAARQPAPP